MIRFILSLLLAFTLGLSHPVYTGLGELSVSDKKISGYLSFDKFDFIRVLEVYNQSPLYLLNRPQLRLLITKYLSSAFSIAFNQNPPVEPQVIGFRQQETSFRINIEFSNYFPIKSLTIKNSVLMRSLPLQVNTLAVTSPDTSYQLIFDNKSPSVQLEIPFQQQTH